MSWVQRRLIFRNPVASSTSKFSFNDVSTNLSSSPFSCSTHACKSLFNKFVQFSSFTGDNQDEQMTCSFYSHKKIIMRFVWTMFLKTLRFLVLPKSINFQSINSNHALLLRIPEDSRSNIYSMHIYFHFCFPIFDLRLFFHLINQNSALNQDMEDMKPIKSLVSCLPHLVTNLPFQIHSLNHDTMSLHLMMMPHFLCN